MSQRKNLNRTNLATEDFAKPPAKPHRLPWKWWELLVFVLMLALAFAFDAMRFPKWTVTLTLLSVIPLVQAIQILLTKRNKAHDKQGS